MKCGLELGLLHCHALELCRPVHLDTPFYLCIYLPCPVLLDPGNLTGVARDEERAEKHAENLGQVGRACSECVGTPVCLLGRAVEGG